MPSDPSIRLLQEASLQGISQICDEVKSLFDRYEKHDDGISQTLKILFWYQSSRSQTVSFLISHGYSWDAEIILRSFYEMSAKILFICFSQDDNKISLVDEFWNGVTPINDRKRARKAAFAEEVFEKGSVSASVFSRLQDERFFDLQTDGSKTQRKKLEQKWSFSEIIEALSQPPTEGKAIKGIKSLLHIYGMASHLIHADQAAMDLMQDRAMRDLSERKILEAAHIARIMSDQVSITWLCAYALRLHFGGTFSDGDKMREVFERNSHLSEPFHTAFDDSQRDFYTRWQDNVD